MKNKTFNICIWSYLVIFFFLILNSSILVPFDTPEEFDNLEPKQSIYNIAINPDPINGSTYMYKNQNLSWIIGNGIEKQYLFFGNSSQSLNCYELTNSDSTFYPGLLQENQWYYWRVDSVMSEENVTGSTWCFFVPGLIEYPTDGNPIGGGYGYNKMLETGTYIVSNKTDFLFALEKVQPNEIIFLTEDAKIDLTDEYNIIIPSNVTIASNRGKNAQSLGGLIYANNDLESVSLLFDAQNGVRITGIRLQGPSNGLWSYYGTLHTSLGSRGIRSSGGFIEIDNCELYNWSYTAIDIQQAPGITHQIHHNYIHDCVGPLGYGVEMGIGSPLIYANIFSGCRHAIAGVGQSGCSYEASYNIVLKSGYNYNSTSAHNFDMHGSYDFNKYLPPFFSLAGNEIRIHHNTFSNPRSDGTNRELRTNGPDIGIRGKPRDICVISNNWFFDEDISHAISQTRARGNMEVVYNYVGMAQIPQDEWDASFWPQKWNSVAMGYYLGFILIFIVGGCCIIIKKKHVLKK